MSNTNPQLANRFFAASDKWPNLTLTVLRWSGDEPSQWPDTQRAIGGESSDGELQLRSLFGGWIQRPAEHPQTAISFGWTFPNELGNVTGTTDIDEANRAWERYRVLAGEAMKATANSDRWPQWAWKVVSADQLQWQDFGDYELSIISDVWLASARVLNSFTAPAGRLAEIPIDSEPPTRQAAVKALEKMLRKSQLVNWADMAGPVFGDHSMDVTKEQVKGLLREANKHFARYGYSASLDTRRRQVFIKKK